MNTRTFKGGVHPPERKELSDKSPITQAFPSSKMVVIPVTMGGAANTPRVKVGEVVAKGQLIAAGDGFMSVPVHSSVAGKVKKIQSCLVTGGSYVPCIFIEADGSGRQQFLEPLDTNGCSPEAIVARIKEAGIVGMGGASFPTHVKLSPGPERHIDYVLANAAECEPYLTCDERVMVETPQRLVGGLSIVLKVFPAAKGVIALEDNKAYIKSALEKAIGEVGQADRISVQLVKTKYPQGSEKFIVSSCLSREIPAGKLPADAGTIICNVGSLCAVSDAFQLGLPLVERALTISGGAVKPPCNLKVPIGTLVSDLVPQYFELKEGQVAKIISGGPMMGFAMPTVVFPVAKGTSGVVFLTKEETYLTDEDQCIGCGKCVDACPMRLSPVLMVRALKADDLDKARKLGLRDCIECGCCSYVCPANVRLVQRFRLGKALGRQQAAAQRAKEQQAQRAKQEASR